MIRIVGDCNFADGYFDIGFGVGSLLKSGKDPFACLYREDADFWIGNFECVASSSTNKDGIDGQYFRIEPELLSHFRHLDLYGVANNHVMQHGELAYNDLLDFIESVGSQYVGSINKKSHHFHHQGKTIGVVAFSQRPDHFSRTPSYWSLPEYTDIQREIDSLEDCDYRIAFIHWGNEFINRPYIDQKQFAHLLVDRGVDLIIGMHPHILQGYEVYNGKHIFYSLGNFVFRMAWEPTHYSIIVSVDFSTDIPHVSYNYAEIDPISGFPHEVESVPEQYTLPLLSKRIYECCENELYYSEVFQHMNEYRKANRIRFIKDLSRLSIKDSTQMIKSFIQRRLK